MALSTPSCLTDTPRNDLGELGKEDLRVIPPPPQVLECCFLGRRRSNKSTRNKLCIQPTRTLNVISLKWNDHNKQPNEAGLRAKFNLRNITFGSRFSPRAARRNIAADKYPEYLFDENGSHWCCTGHGNTSIQPEGYVPYDSGEKRIQQNRLEQDEYPSHTEMPSGTCRG